MFRIDSEGATAGNLFTEGNPSLGVPATVVSAEWLNDTVQEELVGVVEAAGLTLNKGDNTQLLQALNVLVGLGGTSTNIFSVANNTADQAVTGAVYNKADVKAVEVSYDMDFKTDSQQGIESGTVFLSHNPTTDLWEIASVSVDYGTAALGAVFSVTAAGQLRVTTGDFTGTNYSGAIRWTAKQKSQA